MTIGKPMGNYGRRDERQVQDAERRPRDWHEARGRDVSDEHYRRGYGISDDSLSFGDGAYGRDLDYGRRSALGHGGFGGMGHAEHSSGPFGFGTQQYRGVGPSGYFRSDERIHEDACEALTEDDAVDATDIEVSVSGAEVTLRGHVASREQKRRAEDVCAGIRGVIDVHNQLRVENR